MSEIEFLTIPTGTPYKKDLGDCTIGDLEHIVRFRKEMAAIHEEDGIEHSEYCQNETKLFQRFIDAMRAHGVSRLDDLPPDTPI